MSTLTASEFILLYQSNTNEALKWLDETEMDLTTLFTSRVEVEQLVRSCNEKTNQLFQPIINAKNKDIAWSASVKKL